VDAVLQAIIGGMLRDQFADQRHHAVDDVFLAVMAIGKKSVISDV
jgi:hypothetical protein